MSSTSASSRDSDTASSSSRAALQRWSRAWRHASRAGVTTSTPAVSPTHQVLTTVHWALAGTRCDSTSALLPMPALTMHMKMATTANL